MVVRKEEWRREIVGHDVKSLDSSTAQGSVITYTLRLSFRERRCGSTHTIACTLNMIHAFMSLCTMYVYF